MFTNGPPRPWDLPGEAPWSALGPWPHLEGLTGALGGALGGAVASFCTAPFDVVKTRRQTEPPAPRLCHCPPSGTLRRLQAIVAGEGWASLWRGNATRTAKVAPACAIMIGCYELGKELLGDGGRP